MLSDYTLRENFPVRNTHVTNVKVIRSNKAEIEIWHIFDVCSEKRQRRLIAELLLYFGNRGR